MIWVPQGTVEHGGRSGGEGSQHTTFVNIQARGTGCESSAELLSLVSKRDT